MFFFSFLTLVSLNLTFFTSTYRIDSVPYAGYTESMTMTAVIKSDKNNQQVFLKHLVLAGIKTKT